MMAKECEIGRSWVQVPTDCGALCLRLNCRDSDRDSNRNTITTNYKRRLCTSIRAVESRIVMSIIHTLRASYCDRSLALSARCWANNKLKRKEKTMQTLLQIRERLAEKLLGIFPQILSNAMNKPNGDDLLDMWMNGCISSFEMLKYGLTK